MHNNTYTGAIGLLLPTLGGSAFRYGLGLTQTYQETEMVDGCPLREGNADPFSSLS